jgi:4-amino-4-deoxy-L-arabinose transferase-like glycosyltransferase
VTESPLARLVRALLLAAAAVVLLGLVAVAAGGYRVHGSGSSQPAPYAVDTILTIVLALYAVGALVLFATLFWAGLEVRRNPRQAGAKRQRMVSRILVLFGLLALLVIAADRFHWRFNPNRLHQPPAAQTTPAGGAPNAKHNAHSSRQAQFRWIPFLVVVGAAGVAFGAVYAAEKRRRRRLPREPLIAAELVGVLDETLADLHDEVDPRRAVIAAYARMERALAAHGVPRRRFEAPHEYLTRVLGELTGGGKAAARLTALFERARFSAHDVDVTMKAEAIAAVEDLQAELAIAEAAEAA